jgi:hypothetical protein
MANITNKPNPVLTGYLSNGESRLVRELATLLEEQINSRREIEKEELLSKLELKNLLKPAYFKYNERAKRVDEVQHTFDVEDLQVNFTNAYFVKGNQHLQSLVKLLGSEHPLIDSLKESAKISLDVSELDPATANKLATEITYVAVKYGVRPVVERQAGTLKDFHDLRHVYLTSGDNTTLDEELPLVIQVSTPYQQN